jgi:hypothetical protein
MLGAFQCGIFRVLAVYIPVLEKNVKILQEFGARGGSRNKM